MVGILSCFTNVKVSDDKKAFLPVSDYKKVALLIKEINDSCNKFVDLELKNKSKKKSKVIIDSWYASGGKKFFLQDKFKLNSVFRRGGSYYNLVSPPSGLREKFTKLTPG